MQIAKIGGFSINENTAKNLRNAVQARLSRMDCIDMVDCPNAKSCSPDGSRRITARRRNAGSMQKRT